jgi:Flp pilus assembly protein TadD
MPAFLVAWRAAPRSVLAIGLGLALVLSGCGAAQWGWPANHPGAPGLAGRRGGPAGDAVSAEAPDLASDRPPTAKTLHAMAQILAAQGKNAESEWALRRVIHEYPLFMPAYCDLAELYMRQRRPEAAVAVLHAGLEVSPNDPILLNNLGMCRVTQGQYEDAMGLFTQAAAGAPVDARYRANMAMALGMLGRYEESLALYEQVLPPAQAHYNLSILCTARNDSERAIQEYSLSVKLRAAAKGD